METKNDIEIKNLANVIYLIFACKSCKAEPHQTSGLQLAKWIIERFYGTDYMQPLTTINVQTVIQEIQPGVP